jgi:hypothetical protein
VVPHLSLATRRSRSVRTSPTALALVLAALAGCGSGSTARPDGGSPFDDAGPSADAGPLPGTTPVVVFLFDQGLHGVFRLADGNLDGDLNDRGEARRFFDDSAADGLSSSKAMLALGPDELLAADSQSQLVPRDDDLIHLSDLDHDGTAFAAGEASVLFAGDVPAGHLTDPVALARTTDGTLYLADSNLLDTTMPFAIYRLRDADDSGDVSADEVSPVIELNPIGSTARAISDIEVDDAGQLWMLEVGTDGSEQLLRGDPDTGELTTALDNASLLASRELTLFAGLSRMARLPDGELVFQAFTSPTGFANLVAVADQNGDGTIDPDSELRIVWSEALHAARPSNFGARDLAVASDGSILALVATQGTVHRFSDQNLDGDVDDPGEDRIIYDTAQAVASGGENTASLLTLAVTDAD